MSTFTSKANQTFKHTYSEGILLRYCYQLIKDFGINIDLLMGLYVGNKQIYYKTSWHDTGNVLLIYFIMV